MQNGYAGVYIIRILFNDLHWIPGDCPLDLSYFHVAMHIFLQNEEVLLLLFSKSS